MQYRPIFFFTVTYIAGVSSLQPDIRPVVQEISVGKPLNFTFNRETKYLITVSGLVDDIKSVPPRIHVECVDCNIDYPALIILMQDKGVTSFELPMLLKHSEKEFVSYNKTERTLCSYENVTQKNNFVYDGASNYSKLIISLSTSSLKNIVITLNVSLVNNFILKLNESKNFTISPTKPKYFSYDFVNNDKTPIILKVESTVSDCMFVSVQNQTCPIDYMSIRHYKGNFQTVTTLGAFTIKPEQYPTGFYVVFSMCVQDSCCSNSGLGASDREKPVVVSLSKSITKSDMKIAVALTMVVILSVYFVMILYTYISVSRSTNPRNSEDYNALLASTSAHNFGYGDDSRDSNRGDDLSIKTDSSLDETDADVLHDIYQDKNIARSKTNLCVIDLAKKNPTVLKKKSELYFWNVMTMAIFYGLPASQLVITYQYNLNQSGNQDLCYYNFLCSHPLGYINDFNHFFSNIGYISLGVLFLIITKQKEIFHGKLACQIVHFNTEYGVPHHFGLFYAMGTSLIIEGLLSACYHICPNIYNFQFDASFMYVIGTLCIIKIYQSRHPDVNATAYSTFFTLALVLFLQLGGIFHNTHAFWAVLTFFHISILFYLSVNIYYVHTIPCHLKTIWRCLKEYRYRFCKPSKPMYPTRFCLIAVINICNWALAISAWVIGIKDVSSHILIIFIANIMLYTTFYIIMKLISGEKILLQPCLYIALSTACWSAALYFFFMKTISWKKAPAVSRTYNKPCILFDFYDNHDIWHFLSSCGLFFSFLVLLTLDDDLIFKHRSVIPVF